MPMAHVVVTDIAGTTVVKPTHFLKAPTVAELRGLVYESGACVVGSRFKLLRGHCVLQNDELLHGGSISSPALITLVVLPSAGISEDATPLTILGNDNDHLSVSVIDVRTSEAVVIIFRYFLQYGGGVCLGVMATELAPIIGADVVKLAKQASADAIFEDEDVLGSGWPGTIVGGGRLWEVVGGIDSGGILVRDGSSLNSPQLGDRLATGALVEELELLGQRLRYRLRMGRGPRVGWVSLRFGQKELLDYVGVDELPHGNNLPIRTGETFRAIIQLTDLSSVYRFCAIAWHEQNPKMELAERLLAQLSALDPPENDTAAKALQLTMSRVSSWWQTGV
ncbi:unnamed protein product [Polarella glacialis]|uniref:Uncharacterized protein n=1 Tax=Polarella glacialis TaxID=89957 RepID=A0A813JEP7_POLGL|nr:unnamed protein product [Polarella glacialis]